MGFVRNINLKIIENCNSYIKIRQELKLYNKYSQLDSVIETIREIERCKIPNKFVHCKYCCFNKSSISEISLIYKEIKKNGK